MRRVLSWVVIAIAAIAAPAAASDQFALTGGIPARFSGDVAARASEGLLVAEAPTSLSFLGGTVQLTIVQVLHDEVLLPDGSARRLPARVLVIPTDAPLLRFDAPEQVRIRGATIEVSSHGAADAGAVWDRANAQSSLTLVAGDDVPALAGTPHERRADAGLHEFAAQDATASARFPDAQAFGGALDTGAARIHLGDSISEPVPGTLRTTLTFARVQGAEQVEVTAARARLYAADLLIDLDGYAKFPWAEGRISQGATDRGVQDEVLLGGALRLRTLGADANHAPSVSWLGEGDLRSVGLGPAGVDAGIEPAAAAAAGGALLVGAGALAYWWPGLKLGLAGLLAPLYARLPRDRVLEHGARDLVYDRIRAEPGVSANDLAKGVEFGWSTLAYHLRVLERSELIVSVREGRYRRYFDRESGRFANGRKRIVAVLKNAQTRAIAFAVRGAPGSTQKEISERFGLSPSSVHWHVKRLEESALLERRRDGHNVRYSPGAAWAEVDDQDLAAPPAVAAPRVAPFDPTAA